LSRNLNKTSFDPVAKAREYISRQAYRVSVHALQRLEQRSISLREILYVLKNGYHEEAYSVFEVKRQSWKYAIRGKTPDAVDLRVIVAFVEKMAIITVIEIT
jgi:uncharacterized protein DUF4258